MVMIPDHVADQIRSNINIVDIIGEYTDLKRSGSSFKGLCPFHNEKTPSFTVDEKKQLFHCFGCHAGGDVVSFLMQKEGYTFVEAMEFLANKAGVDIQYTSGNAKNKRNKELYEINKDVMMFYYKKLLTSKEAISYLKQRDLSSKLVNRFMLGYADGSWDDLLNYIEYKGYDKKDLEEIGLIKKNKSGGYYDKYRSRIIFPIINHFGNVIGFGGRSIDGSEPKYLNSPESDIFKKRYNLYGLNVYKKQKGKDIILVEGYMDVISLNNHGINYAVASLGTALTSDQAKLIKRYADNVYICYDRDAAGIKATDKAVDIFLEEDVKAKIIILEEGLDPDDYIKEYGKDSFLEKKDKSLDVYNYKYNKILDIYSQANDNEKLEKLDLFVEFLASIKSDLTKDIFVNNIHTLTGIDKNTLNNAVIKYSNNIDKKNNNTNFRTNDFKKKVIVESRDSEINTNELEILRLIFNQRDDYINDKEFFDQALHDEKVLNVRDFILNKDTNKFDLNDQDYTYILNYIRDNTNPILVGELKEKIIQYERYKKLVEIKSLKNKVKGSTDE